MCFSCSYLKCRLLRGWGHTRWVRVPHIVMGWCGLMSMRESLRKSKVFWETVKNGSGCCESECSLIFSSGFKSQSSPWMKWCSPNYQVHKGSHLLCCPLPTMLGALVPPHQEEVWFSQSRSSRLWPVPYCHEQITRSCQSPAETQRQEIITKHSFFNLT